MGRGNDSPSFDHELRLADLSGGRVAGIDEAGRGPWAGPVVAAAVVLDPAAIPHGLDDSKRLSAAQRQRLFDQIMDLADVGVGTASVTRIDRDNILAATLWAMSDAFGRLRTPAAAALIDGNRAPGLPCRTECLVKGDQRSVSIAAASIIAKVTRDRIMCELAACHPGYGWERNKGYGTSEHAEALRRFGVTPAHRRSYAPVRRALGLA